MAKLVLIGGPPGVGKSTVLPRLPGAFDRCAWLDADDVWRVHPDELVAPQRAWADENVIAVLRGYLAAGFPLVFLGWVLANPDKIRRILDGLAGAYESHLVVHLTASPEALKERSEAKYARGLAAEYQDLKAKQIDALPFPRIDTSLLAPDEVVRELARLVGADPEG